MAIYTVYLSDCEEELEALISFDPMSGVEALDELFGACSDTELCTCLEEFGVSPSPHCAAWRQAARDMNPNYRPRRRTSPEEKAVREAQKELEQAQTELEAVNSELLMAQKRLELLNNSWDLRQLRCRVHLLRDKLDDYMSEARMKKKILEEAAEIDSQYRAALRRISELRSLYFKTRDSLSKAEAELSEFKALLAPRFAKAEVSVAEAAAKVAEAEAKVAKAQVKVAKAKAKLVAVEE